MHMMKNLHLTHLEAVEATLRLGTFRAAATELGVSSAALGQRIRALENHLDVSLFERRPDGVQATEKAQLIRNELAIAFAQINNVMSQLSDEKRANRIAISMTQAFAENWLPLQLPGFLEHESNAVDFRMESSRALADLHSGAFDFVVRYCAGPTEAQTGIKLFQGCLVPLCSPDFARRYDLSSDTVDLTGVPLIHLDDPTTDPAWVDWAKWCAYMRVPAPAYEGNTTFSKLSSGLRMAQSGLGLVLSGVPEALSLLRDGQLIMPFSQEKAILMEHAYWLLWNKNRSLTPLCRRFRGWLKDRAAADRQTLPATLTELS